MPVIYSFMRFFSAKNENSSLLSFRLFQTCLIFLFYAKQTEKCLSVDLSMQCKSVGSNIILDPIAINWKKKFIFQDIHVSE